MTNSFFRAATGFSLVVALRLAFLASAFGGASYRSLAKTQPKIASRLWQATATIPAAKRLRSKRYKYPYKSSSVFY